MASATGAADFEELTGFFRDGPAWDYIRNEIVPRLVEESEAHDGIRIWSTGCAGGEEAYSLALCFAEAMPSDGFRDRLKIYATDVDEEALTDARHGIYAAAKLDNVPQDLRERYFEQIEQRYLVKPDLRRSVIFGRHDVFQDPPISRIDLLTSRNTLMYFTPDAQSQILTNFHFALRDHGYLFLGKSEPMPDRSNLFTPVDLEHRVFQKTPRDDAFRPLPRPWPASRYERPQQAVEYAKRDVEAAYGELQSTVEELERTHKELQSANEELDTINDELNQRTDELNKATFFLESILDSLGTSVVVLDDELRVTAWNEGAHDLWGLRADEVQGRHFMNLDIGLPVEQLRTALRRLLAGTEIEQPILVEATNWRGRAITCRVRLSLLTAGADGPRGLVVFMEADEP
jgi:PAS domain S-box-containing protein